MSQNSMDKSFSKCTTSHRPEEQEQVEKWLKRKYYFRNYAFKKAMVRCIVYTWGSRNKQIGTCHVPSKGLIETF